MPGPRAADRAIWKWAGATPLFETLLRVWGRVGFHNHRPAPQDSPPFVKGRGPCRVGSLPSQHRSLQEGPRNDQQAHSEDSFVGVAAPHLKPYFLRPTKRVFGWSRQAHSA